MVYFIRVLLVNKAPLNTNNNYFEVKTNYTLQAFKSSTDFDKILMHV